MAMPQRQMFAKTGDLVVITAGMPLRVTGTTNLHKGEKIT
jgi:pyruvate kinase